MSVSLSETTLKKLFSFRKNLHKFPELSGKEKNTARLLHNFLVELNPEEIFTELAGHGLVAVFDSGKPGPVILLRADMDALPIQEVNNFDHKSSHEGVSHKCGHDGHMTILLGVAKLLSDNRPGIGKVMLLFQPEEETGMGAEKILRENLFKKYKPGWVFALHNLPGFPKSSVIIREGPFAAASKGMIINLEGHSSHAAHPEQGNSPVRMMTSLIDGLMSLPDQKDSFKGFTLLTVIHSRLGEIAFGTNPGEAAVMATLRTFYDHDMEVLTKMAEQLVNNLSKEHNIRYNISYTEIFPATINHSDAASVVRNAAQDSGCKVITAQEPFRWSEDFGHFTGRYPGALFGLGSGQDHPSLHNNHYDFPDSIINAGVNIFNNIISRIQQKKEN